MSSRLKVRLDMMSRRRESLGKIDHEKLLGRRVVLRCKLFRLAWPVIK